MYIICFGLVFSALKSISENVKSAKSSDDFADFTFSEVAIRV